MRKKKDSENETEYEARLRHFADKVKEANKRRLDYTSTYPEISPGKVVAKVMPRRIIVPMLQNERPAYDAIHEIATGKTELSKNEMTETSWTIRLQDTEPIDFDDE